MIVTIGSAELRAVVREYVLLDAERALVAAGSSRDHLRGAAQISWLERTRKRLDELRWQLVGLAIVDAAKKTRR